MTKKIIFLLFLLATTFFFGCMVSSLEAVSLPSIQLGVDDVEDPEKISSALQVLFLLTILTL
ncbi:MAG: flagellar biosynthetic protein FliP, partial [Nitrospinota bacterium]|nr:flagellar biosynthetic protein FliP [Nitrospinota bacterium]